MNSQSEIVQGISKKWEVTKQKKYKIGKRNKKTVISSVRMSGRVLVV